LQLPNRIVKALALRMFLLIVALGVALAFGIVLWFAINNRLDEHRLRTVQTTFRGLSRNEAYARLRQMRLTPVAWATWSNDFIPSRESHTIPWPSHSDVEIDFGYAYRPHPDGACGANATAILVFDQEHVAKISEDLDVGACM
jgi:hypothetical protein